jgi:hypothetical protein
MGRIDYQSASAGIGPRFARGEEPERAEEYEYQEAELGIHCLK